MIMTTSWTVLNYIAAGVVVGSASLGQTDASAIQKNYGGILENSTLLIYHLARYARCAVWLTAPNGSCKTTEAKQQNDSNVGSQNLDRKFPHEQFASTACQR